MTRLLRSLRLLAPVLTLGLLAASLLVVHRELQVHPWREIRADVSAVPIPALLFAGTLTVVNYLVLIGYDTLAVRYAGVHLQARRIALASTLGYALSQALGLPLLTGAPVRVRLYGSWGVDGAGIARILTLNSMTYWVGVGAVGGALLVGAPPGAIDGAVTRSVGVALLGALGLYLAWCLRRGPVLRGPTFQLSPPSPGLAASQVVVSTADWVVASAVLYVLLPVGHGVGFGAFIAVFVAAQVLGMLSHVPGGLGVFEATLLSLMPDSVGSSDLFASLVAYRVVYYLLPLAVAGFSLTLLELRQGRARVARALSGVQAVFPTVAAGGAFVMGALLLLLGSMPIPAGRLEWLATWLHPATINVSHFAASLSGTVLILVAGGLQRRLQSAYHIAVAALAAITVLSVTTYAAPVLSALSGMAGLGLWASRERFFRSSSLAHRAFSARWTVAILAAVGSAAWLGILATRDVQYRDELWWRFTLDSDAPRFLRASVGVAVLLLVASIARLLRGKPHVPQIAQPDVLETIAPMVRACPRTVAHLALLGDKSILSSDTRRSFIMYGVHGSSWIAMGDPVGEPSEFEALLWRFREEADRVGDEAVFYQVAPPYVPLYVDMGMSLFKVGEEGRVSLRGLTLEGKRWSDQRQAVNRLTRLGAQFAVLPKEAVPERLPALRAISDEWLAEKRIREKGFSLGRFEETYVARNPIAIALLGGRPVAFATLWESEVLDELSIDLMRFGGDAPKGSMDFLFANLLIWGRDRGYAYFNLGVAPLAGLEDHPLAPFWHKVGGAVFAHGERLYNFQGLYEFKEKYDPEWESRYIAVAGLRHLPRAFADIAFLIAGGSPGVLGK